MGRPLVSQTNSQHPSHCSCPGCFQSHPIPQSRATNRTPFVVDLPGDRSIGQRPIARSRIDAPIGRRQSALTSTTTVPSNQTTQSHLEDTLGTSINTPRLTPQTLQTIEQTTDSLRRVTTAIETAYQNLAVVRDNIRVNMDGNNSTNSTSDRTTVNNGGRSLFNSDMAPSHSAIVLADGTEVISPVRPNSRTGLTSNAVGGPSRSGAGTRTSAQRSPLSSAAALREGSYSQYMERYTREYYDRQNRIPRPVSDTPSSSATTRQNSIPAGSAALPGRPTTLSNPGVGSLESFVERLRTAVRRTESHQSDSSDGEDNLGFPNPWNRSASERRAETQRNDRHDWEHWLISPPTPPLPAPNTSNPRDESTDDLPENDASLFFGAFRRNGAAFDPDDPSTTLGRRVTARAAAAAARNSERNNSDSAADAFGDTVFERASDLANRLEGHLDRLARHRTDLLEASNGLRRGSSSTSSSPNVVRSLTATVTVGPTSRPHTRTQRSRPTGRMRTEDEVYQTPSQRTPGRTSHVDRNGRLSYNPTLPASHPLAYIHVNPSVPIPGLTSQDFHRIDPVSGRRRRYSIISPVRDGADGVHTVTMSDSSSEDDDDDGLALRRRRVRPRPVRIRHARALSHGDRVPSTDELASMAAANRDMTSTRPRAARVRGTRRNLSRDRMPLLSLVSDHDDDEELFPVNRPIRLNDTDRDRDREGQFSSTTTLSSLQADKVSRIQMVHGGERLGSTTCATERKNMPPGLKPTRLFETSSRTLENRPQLGHRRRMRVRRLYRASSLLLYQCSPLAETNLAPRASILIERNSTQ
ncbi:unnamed protein product [Somion occarium]|uniref:Uncharacterized protein n=1 Tax=Somion occarium TaxID=3059160 RepID=A0ABP1CPM9_9APHY